MHIEIAERLKPFSHTPGTVFILPGTNYRVQVFPACFRIDDLSGQTPAPLVQANMNIVGPLEQFTIEQDLEKCLVRIWGESKEGFLRYTLSAFGEGPGVKVVFEKTPSKGISILSTGLWGMQGKASNEAGDVCLIVPEQTSKWMEGYAIPLIDRLSLGNHKSQNWDQMRGRLNFVEIFPIWHRLGQLVPEQPKNCSIGTLNLLSDCREAINASKPENILPCFKKTFLAGFEGGLSPRLIDTDFHGILKCEEIESQDVSPMLLLTEGSKLIRSLFVQVDSEAIHLLPACPPEFHCGRLINTSCGNLGTVTIEWTKKSMRCMRFVAASTQKVMFAAHDGQRSCRLRTSLQDRGRIYELGKPLDVIEGREYLFDNFVS